MLDPNSPSTILERIQSRRVGWAGPLLMTTARTGLILFVQVVVATVFLIRGDPTPWRTQAPWWTVYARLVDIGCLLPLRRQTKREGIRLIDLFGMDRSRLRREALGVFCTWSQYFLSSREARSLRVSLCTERRNSFPPC